MLQQSIAQDYWRVFKKHFNITQKDDSEWENLVAEMDAVAERYKDTPSKAYSGEMYLVFLRELERMSK